MLVVSVERCYACFMLSAVRLKEKGPSWASGEASKVPVRTKWPRSPHFGSGFRVTLSRKAHLG